MKKVTSEQLPELFEAIAERFVEQEDELCRMDEELGDGDLGITMRKGFTALPEKLRSMEEPDFSKKIRKAGIEMTDLVPSTMGMLMGTGISNGGKALEGRQELDGDGLADFLDGFCEGIIKRGKCSRGDCTVLDSIAAAAEEARRVLRKDISASLEEVSAAALKGAKRGVEETKEMVPKYGKAAVHAQSSVGMADQGAVAGMIMIQGIVDYIMK